MPADTLAESIERYRKKSIPEAMLAFTAVVLTEGTLRPAGDD